MAHPTTRIQIHLRGRWEDAADLQAWGDDRCRFDYLPEYVFGRDPVPLAVGLPVGHEPDRFIEGPSGQEPDRRPPPILYDLVPQGRGRKFLAERLALKDHDNLILPLVMAGAFNPIGCLRLTSAVDFFEREAAKQPDAAVKEGFALEDVLTRSDDFLNHLSVHAMLASGTTGVQGVAPKFLLTTDRDGRWHADMALADERANEHWLVKLPRGSSDADRAVLRNEAAYLRLAAACGLRVHHPPQHHGDALFVRRFDREVSEGRTYRLHQESLASAGGQRGMAMGRNMHALVTDLRSVTSHPAVETLEFLKRDVLNQAMRNTDNHTRNTAIQRMRNGNVRLTPLFDFAPMFLDPEVIARSCFWRDMQDRVQGSWREVMDTLPVGDAERAWLVSELAAFAPIVGQLPAMARSAGVDEAVLDQCLRAIDKQAEQLEALAAGVTPATAMPDSPRTPARKRNGA